ncbi:MAG: Na+/proline symporter [Latescibacteria bacterium DG_63]|nr:MAG: Na+/proline symporter [Latescibacteria bacterium DG_63]
MITALIISLFGLIILLTPEDYMVASRRIGITVMFFFVLFAISSAWTFYGYPGFLYRHGVFYVYFVWGCVASFAGLYMFLGPRLWAIARLNGFLSPVEVIGERYESRALRILISLILLAFIVPYIGIQPLGVGLGFKALTGISPVFGIVYTTVLLVVIVFLGGMRTTAWVNVFLGSIYMVAFLGSLVWIVSRVFPGGLSEAVNIVKSSSPELYVAPGPEGYFEPLIIGGVFVVGLMGFAWPHVVMATLTAQDKSVFKWIPLLALVVGGLGFYTIPFVWGAIVAPAISYMHGSLVPHTAALNPDNIVQTIISKYLPGWFAGFVLIGVIAAAVSTAAVQLMTSAIFVSRDIMYGGLMKTMRPARMVLLTKVAVIALVLLALLIAVQYSMALALYLTKIAVPGFAQWAPLLVGAVFWRRSTKYGAMSGMICGTAYLVAGYFYPPIVFHLDNPLIPALLVNITVFVVVSLMTRSVERETIERFYDEVDEYLKKA